MKAEKSQIPGDEASTIKSTGRTHTTQDSVWAMLRRLDARLSTLEVQLNVVRTMAMRTERKIYRAEDKNPPSDILAAERERAVVPDGIFG